MRSGLTSEFFIVCFAKPGKPYDIAKIIKNVEANPDVSKIYPARDRLVAQGYVERHAGKYRPVYSKLAQEIAELLHAEENKTLDENEIVLLEFILRHSKFARLLHGRIAEMIRMQKTGIRNIDSLKFIASMVGSICMFLWSIKQGLIKNENELEKLIKTSKQVTVKDLEEFELQWEKISDSLADILGKFFAKKITIKNDGNPDKFDGLEKKDIVKSILSSVPIFFMMADSDLLEKIAVFAKGRDSMEVVRMIFSLNFANQSE